MRGKARRQRGGAMRRADRLGWRGRGGGRLGEGNAWQSRCRHGEEAKTGNYGVQSLHLYLPVRRKRFGQGGA
jgi:hypothetical protein